ncbi:MAG: ATP-dependent sacrificial sulfur transferase LarE [Planctomycetota bacterium]
MNEKYNLLSELLGGFGRVLVAYSGGVDSTFLLKAAVDTLGADNVLGCIGLSPSLAQSQRAQAAESAKAIGAAIREVRLDELADEAYSANKADRCFHCKSHLYGLLKKIAEEEGIGAVLCGSNFDDKDDFRPGNRAAKVFGVHSTLADAELGKDEIRELSRQLGLATADMPASPCLASRISYGLEVNEQRLKQVEEAEDFVRGLGFDEFRVRHHGDLARIEVPAGEIEKLTSLQRRTKIIENLKGLGFKYVTCDLQGFRSGALNEALTEDEKQKSN